MSASENKAIIRRMVETVWNGHDANAGGQFHADEFTVNGEAFNPAKFGEGVDGTYSCYSDLQVTDSRDGR